MIPDAMLAEWEARAQQIGDWPMRQAIEEIRRLRGEVARTQGILQGWITTAVTRGDALAAHQAVVRELAEAGMGLRNLLNENQLPHHSGVTAKNCSRCSLLARMEAALAHPLVVAARKGETT